MCLDLSLYSFYIIFMKQVAQFQIQAQKLALLYFFLNFKIIILLLLILFHCQEDLLKLLIMYLVRTTA